MLGAITTGLLLPWSEQIVMIFLGKAYAQAWPVLAIMLLASGQTYRHMLVSMGVMLISVPFSYLMLAPATGVLVPGLEMGAIGIASKMVVLGMLSVNIQAWVIARYSGWKLDWKFQAVGIPLMIGLGYLAKILVGLLWNLEDIGMADLIVPVILAAFFYLVSVAWLLWLQPWLIGMNREEIMSLFGKLRGGAKL